MIQMMTNWKIKSILGLMVMGFSGMLFADEVVAFYSRQSQGGVEVKLEDVKAFVAKEYEADYRTHNEEMGILIFELKREPGKYCLLRATRGKKPGNIVAELLVGVDLNAKTITNGPSYAVICSK